jgi:glycosyltransferase involved in cell wall biosynthesis
VGYAWWLMENFWSELGEMAAEQGARTFVAFPEVREVSPTLRDAPVTPVELPVPTALRPGVPRVARFIVEHRVRTLYLTDRAYWSPAYALYRLLGVRSIILHDHMPGERTDPGRLRLALKRARHLIPGTGADLYLGVSRFVQRRFTAIAGVPAGRCDHVLNGVPGGPRTIRSLHETFGIPADGRVVISSGRAVYYKGIDFLIRCAARVVRDHGRSDVYFLHLGDGPDMAEFRRMVRERDLEDHFILAGNRSDVRALLPGATLALHASRGEAFSLAILEFMAAGLPAVVPDHCGNGEAVRDGVTGFLYEPGDLDEAVDRVLRLLDEPVAARRLGEAAAERARKRFSLERMNDTFRAVVGPHIRT